MPPNSSEAPFVEGLEGIPLTGVVDPSEADVLCGRGGAALRHPGNQTYRRLVNLNKGLYITCPKTEKLKISRSIVKTIREQKGRFLEKSRDDDSTWADIGDRKAIEKTSQALREGQPKLRQKIVEMGGGAAGTQAYLDAQISANGGVPPSTNGGPIATVGANLNNGGGGDDGAPPPPQDMSPMVFDPTLLGSGTSILGSAHSLLSNGTNNNNNNMMALGSAHSLLGGGAHLLGSQHSLLTDASSTTAALLQQQQNLRQQQEELQRQLHAAQQLQAAQQQQLQQQQQQGGGNMDVNPEMLQRLSLRDVNNGGAGNNASNNGNGGNGQGTPGNNNNNTSNNVNGLGNNSSSHSGGLRPPSLSSGRGSQIGMELGIVESQQSLMSDFSAFNPGSQYLQNTGSLMSLNPTNGGDMSSFRSNNQQMRSNLSMNSGSNHNVNTNSTSAANGGNPTLQQQQQYTQLLQQQMQQQLQQQQMQQQQQQPQQLHMQQQLHGLQQQIQQQQQQLQQQHQARLQQQQQQQQQQIQEQPNTMSPPLANLNPGQTISSLSATIIQQQQQHVVQQQQQQQQLMQQQKQTQQQHTAAIETAPLNDRKPSSRNNDRSPTSTMAESGQQQRHTKKLDRRSVFARMKYQRPPSEIMKQSDSQDEDDHQGGGGDNMNESVGGGGQADSMAISNMSHVQGALPDGVEVARVVDHSTQNGSSNDRYGNDAFSTNSSKRSLMSGLSRISDADSLISDLSKKIGICATGSSRSIGNMSDISAIDLEDIDEHDDGGGNDGDRSMVDNNHNNNLHHHNPHHQHHEFNGGQPQQQQSQQGVGESYDYI